MFDGKLRVIVKKEEIFEKVGEAAAWLNERFSSCPRPPVAVCVLKGAVFFFCDLMRAVNFDAALDFIKISSYGGGTESSGAPEMSRGLTADVAGRDVILVEDVVDTGITLEFARKYILGKGAKSFTSVALFDKPSRRTAPIKADFACFTADDKFIVGYGLDYAEKYRNLPFVAEITDGNQG